MWFARSSFAAILLISPTLFAQHTTSAASASHTSSSSASVSHTSAPTSAIHSAPASAPMHTSSPSPVSASHNAPTTTAVKAEPKEPAPKEAEPKESVVKRVLPPVETAEAEKAERKENPDLRRPVLCGGKPCKIIDGGDQTELRKHICLKEPCSSPCPSGVAAGKNGGCVGTPPTPSVAHMLQACPAGQVWNGAVCVPSGAQCQPGQISNGVSCQENCASITGGSGNLTLELRSARQERDRVCMKDPGSIQCQQAEMSYSGALQRYQMFLAGVPTQCRSGLPDPISL